MVVPRGCRFLPDREFSFQVVATDKLVITSHFPTKKFTDLKRAIILCCHCRLVYDRFRKALAVEWAVCWFSTVTGLFLAFLFFVFLAFVADLLVVAVDNILYIGHTTVA